MISLNEVFLVGNVGNDPEFKTFQDGRSMASFSLATSTAWKDKTSGDFKNQTEWHKIVCFSKNICEKVHKSVKKGSKLLIQGSLRYRSYVDKNGQTKYITEIILNDYNSKLLLLESKDKSKSEDFNNSDIPIYTGKKFFDKNKFEIDDEIPF